MKKIAFIILLSVLSSFAQNTYTVKVPGGFRFSFQPINADWGNSSYHAVGSYALCSTFDQLGMKWWKGDLITFSLGVLFEVKDGYMPYEKYGWAGGEGFSKKDLLCNATGILTHRVFSALVKTVKKSKKYDSLIKY
jgi:hypothetical protein